MYHNYCFPNIYYFYIFNKLKNKTTKKFIVIPTLQWVAMPIFRQFVRKSNPDHSIIGGHTKKWETFKWREVDKMK